MKVLKRKKPWFKIDLVYVSISGLITIIEKNMNLLNAKDVKPLRKSILKFNHRKGKKGKILFLPMQNMK
jgi:hypothetical protein